MSYTNKQIGHMFVYGDTSRASGSNFHIEFNRLYSYSSLMVIRDPRLNVFLVSEDIATYSNTSCKHYNNFRRAVPVTMQIITLKRGLNRSDTLNTLDKHDLNDSFIEPIKELLVKQSRARKTSYFYQIDQLLKEAYFVAQYGNIDKRSKEYKEFTKLYTSDLKKDYLELIEQYKKDKETETRKEAKKRYKKNLERLESFTGESMKQYTPEQIINFDFLAIKDDKLCTNKSVCVNLRETLLLYRRLVTGKNIIGAKIGQYTIINKTKNYITIGCHKILIKELDRALWITDAPEPEGV